MHSFIVIALVLILGNTLEYGSFVKKFINNLSNYY